MLSVPLATPAQELEDPLAYLPCSTILEYAKGEVIYGASDPSTALHLIIDGRVKVQRIIAERVALLVDIYSTDDFFGESAFVSSSETHEIAAALEQTRVMTWGRSKVEELIPQRPRLAIALLQLLTRRCRYLGERIESCSYDHLDRRLARTLFHFAARFGRIAEDGSTRMRPLSHRLLAQYLGGSRELVTNCMIGFRRKGYVRYSRHEIVLYPEGLRKLLEQPIISSARRATGL